MIKRIWPHLPHILLFARQELLDKHRDSMLGLLWLFLQPVSYILVFALVFSGIMRARMTGFEDQPFAYTQYLVSGLLIWLLMANTLSQLSGIYQSKSHIIRKIPVSLSLMPLYVPITESIIFLVGMAAFALILSFAGSADYTVWLWMPLVLSLTLLMVYPLGLILGMLSVFLPDIRTATPILLQLLFWLTPIVYLPNILPASLASWLLFNPFFWPVSSMQNIVLYQQPPAFTALLAMAFWGLCLGVLARLLQKRLEKDLRDLI